LTKEEAAELLHTTPRHIERLAEENRLAHYRVGRFFRFELDEIEQYLERTHVAAKEDV
jgi:excisionase family DNA binding protein